MPNGSCSEKGKTRFFTVLGGGLQIICFIFTPKKLGEMESNLTFAYFIQLSWNHQQTWRFHHVLNWWLLWVAMTSESWWKHSRNGELGVELVGRFFFDFGWFRGRVKPRKTRDTVDGNQIFRRENQLRIVEVGSLSQYLQNSIHSRWLALGFLNHQQKVLKVGRGPKPHPLKSWRDFKDFWRWSSFEKTKTEIPPCQNSSNDICLCSKKMCC